jgi:hypothetical protein
MYKYKKPIRSSITSVDVTEGETIEMKCRRMVENKEPIKDGAPEIFTEAKEGVLSAYNIRTDRWEVAAEAMDAISRSKEAKAKDKALSKDDANKAEEKANMKVVKDQPNDGKAESAQGK